MADNPVELTTEQLLVELGKVVMGLGRKIEALGEKLDNINESLSREPSPGVESSTADLTPLLEKLDNINESLSREPSPGVESSTADLTPLLEKLDSINESLSREPSPGVESSTADLTPLLEQLEKLNENLSREPSPGVESSTADLTPLLEKLDSINESLSREPAPGVEPVTIDLTPLLERLDELKEAVGANNGEAAAEALKQGLQDVLGLLSGEVVPALRELKPAQEEKPFDFSPVTERMDEMKQALEKTFTAEDLKPSMDNLSAALQVIPSDVAAKLHELQIKDDRNPMEGVEKRLDDLSASLAELQKAAGDREFVTAISEAIEGVGGKLDASNTSVLEAVKEIPVKMDKLDGSLSGAVKELLEKTDSLTKETGENLAGSRETLEQVKEELEKGLKLNTEMTGRMVDITSAFADRAKEDMLSDLNSRAVTHYNRGEFAQANQLFQEALQTAPDNPEILCNRGHVLAALEKAEDAEASFRKALELAPEMEPAFSSLGLLMVKTGRAEETIEFLRKQIENGEPSVLTAIAYSRALAATGKHEQAVDLLEMCQRGSPDSPELKEELSRYGNEQGE